jgi:hypothetical protein
VIYAKTLKKLVHCHVPLSNFEKYIGDSTNRKEGSSCQPLNMPTGNGNKNIQVPPKKLAANSNKIQFLPVYFTLTVWEMAKMTSHQRRILKIQKPLDVLI